jgi:hypothetical protein
MQLGPVVEANTYLQRCVIVCTSHGPKKVSYHIIIHGFHVESARHAKYIATNVRKELTDYEAGFVDLSIYSRFQQFRMLGSQKLGEDPGRPKVLQRTWNYQGRVIEHQPQWLNPEGEFLETLISCIDHTTSKLIELDIPGLQKVERMAKSPGHFTTDCKIDPCVMFDVDEAKALLGNSMSGM